MALEVEGREPASEDQITTVEAELGLRLPDQYRNWLRVTNGGRVPDYTEVPQSPYGEFFNKIDSVEKLPGLRRLEDGGVMPKAYLPISLGDGGSIALKIEDDDYGSVWWASTHDAEVKGIVDGPSEEIMHRLADDWDAFLAMDFEA